MSLILPFVGLCVLLALGHLAREKIKLFQRLYLPSCVIAGLLGLLAVQLIVHLAGPEMPTYIGSNGQETTWRPGAPQPSSWPGADDNWSFWTRLLVNWTGGWGLLPGALINVVFACLFLGVSIPPVRTLWRKAGPQLAYGQIVAWGQYVVGIGLFLLVVTPLLASLNLPAMFGAIVPVGFEGGHGTAGGLKNTFADLNWQAGYSYAMASATVGILSAVIVGMGLVNWAARRGYVQQHSKPEAFPEDDTIGVIPLDQRPVAGRLTVRSDAIETFTLHLVIVGLAILIGYGIKQGLVLGYDAVSALFADGAPAAAPAAEGAGQKALQGLTVRRALQSFPLFPLCMIGGLIVQLIEQKYDKHKIIDAGLTRRIQNFTLDFLVVAAMSTIRLEVLVAGLAAFLLIVAGGILWNVFCVTFLARRLLPDAWFERSIAEMGQSMGVTATGLLLLRVVDPEYRTPAAEAFAYKQILHEPFMGGGLWTSAAIPLLALWGGWPVLGIAAGAVGIWLVVSLTVFRVPRAAGA